MTNRAFGMRKRRNEGRWLLAFVLMATTALVMTPKAEAQSSLMHEHGWFAINDVSGDGTTFLVNQLRQGGGTDAYIQNAAGQMRLIPDMGGALNSANAITRDGMYVAGDGTNVDGARMAWRYSVAAGGVMTPLGTLVPLISTASSFAKGISDDGMRVAGHSNWQATQRAFVWIEGATGGVVGNEQMYGLDALAGGYNRSVAHNISGNGRYVVGRSDGASITDIAVRWDLAGIESGGNASVQNLGSLTGMDGTSRANGVSYDGSVVVGESRDADGRTRAFRWREGATDGVEGNPEMLDLDTLGGQNASSSAVTRDGNWVVGYAEDENDVRLAFRWSEEAGMESVADWLERNGVDVGTNVLENASSISDDGKVITGMLVTELEMYRAFLARGESAHGAGLMDIEEYHQTLYSAAGIANTGEFLTWLPMNGAHHRPLMLTPNLSGDMCAWATGDFAHHGLSSTGLALAEIGACTELAGGNIRIGGSVGTTASWQDLALGGSARMQGQYVLSEIDWQPDGTPLLLSVTGMLGSYKANIDRAYSNGAATAMSKGETDAFGGVVRVRADWLEAAVLGNTSINPYASLGFGGLHVNGYTETGGPFPALFNAQSLGHADIRLGVTAVTEFSASTTLSTTLEVAHRTGTAAAATGHVPGLFNFNLGGGTYAQTWARVGAELDHKVSDNLSLSTSLHLASNGRDPSIAASAGIKGAF